MWSALAIALALGAAPPEPGPVIAVGGGNAPPVVYRRALALAGGADAKVVVLPQATRSRSAGHRDLREWKAAGAKHVTNLTRLGRGAREVIAKADILWFGGGSQNRLMKSLRRAGLVDAIVARHRAGAVVGGISAGAAVLSGVMLSGPPKPGPLRRGGSGALTGLGVWPEVIVDQHLLARRRLARLITAVLDHPGKVGVGVGEDTAAIRVGDHIEVLGKGQVVIVDGRGATLKQPAKGGRRDARDVRIHVLAPGSSWQLAQ